MSRDGYTDTFVKQSRNPAAKRKTSKVQHKSYGYDHDPTTGKESTYRRRDKYVSRYDVEEDNEEYYDDTLNE